VKATKPNGQVNSAALQRKNTHKAQSAEKTPARRFQKAPTRTGQKTPSYYIPSEVRGLVGSDELIKLLVYHKQHEWCSLVRLGGLLLLLEFFAMRRDQKGVSCSADLAHSYVSKLGRRNSSTTIPEPLAVLCKVQLLRLTQPAVNGWHVKTSAVYAFHEDYAGRSIQVLKVALPPKLIQKRQQAQERYEKRLCQRQPFRAQLQQDLRRLGFGNEARRMIAKFSRDPKLRSATQTVVTAIDCQQHKVKQSPRGQITTSISSCPKPLKKLLLLDGQATLSCDISHAHHCFLPRILSDRIAHIRQHHGGAAKTADHETERARLVAFLSEGDYYRKWDGNQKDDSRRDKTKKLVNVILNMLNDRCAPIGLYQSMRRTFPRLFCIVEEIKRRDHRNISKQLQHHTAKAICGALLEIQGQGIPAIPDVDAIICQEQHRETVCEAIGRHVYQVSGGVCCKVDGIRYESPRLAGFG
jgi:hypothetical protein